MRMFVALLPPAHALEHLAEFLAPRREAASMFRWTGQEQWHVTLGFLPEVSERRIDDLHTALGRAAARRTPISMSIAGGGAFPDVAKAKVIYAGLDVGPQREELDRLSVGVRAAANNAGVKVDGGTFHPHVTLARLNHPLESSRWIRVLNAYRGPAWTASEIVLVASYLGEGPRRSPRYEVAESFPLAATP